MNINSDACYLDLDVIQQYIKKDLDQNEYFQYEHDIDFNVQDDAEFFDCLDSFEEPPKIDRYSNINRHFNEPRRPLIEDLQISTNEDKEERNSSDSFDEEFHYQQDICEIQQIQNEKKIISIFTLKQDFFENEQNTTNFIKNIEMKKNANLEEFYKYIKELKLNGQNQLDSQRYHFLVEFHNILLDIIKKMNDIFKFQTKWLEIEPLLTLQNTYKVFSCQWERFQDYIISLINKSSIGKLHKIIDLESTNRDIDFYPQFDEQQDEFIVQSNLTSLAIFKITELINMHEHFMHIRNQSRLAKRMKNYFTFIRSRIELYKLIKNRATLVIKKKKTQQCVIHQPNIEKIFQIEPNIKLKNISTLGYETTPNKIKHQILFIQRKQMNQIYNSYKIVC